MYTTTTNNRYIYLCSFILILQPCLLALWKPHRHATQQLPHWRHKKHPISNHVVSTIKPSFHGGQHQQSRETRQRFTDANTVVYLASATVLIYRQAARFLWLLFSVISYYLPLLILFTYIILSNIFLTASLTLLLHTLLLHFIYRGYFYYQIQNKTTKIHTLVSFMQLAVLKYTSFDIHFSVFLISFVQFFWIFSKKLHEYLA